MTGFRRYHEDNVPYFVTSVVKDRRSVFSDGRVATKMLSILDESRQRYAFLVLAFAIMPDHFHAVIVPGPRDSISSVMRFVKGSFARWMNVERGTTGSVWQSRFHDIAIRGEEELVRRIEYVERNPVEAGMVGAPEDYEFSSAWPAWRSDLADYLSQAEGLAHR